MSEGAIISIVECAEKMKDGKCRTSLSTNGLEDSKALLLGRIKEEKLSGVVVLAQYIEVLRLKDGEVIHRSSDMLDIAFALQALPEPVIQGPLPIEQSDEDTCLAT